MSMFGEREVVDDVGEAARRLIVRYGSPGLVFSWMTEEIQ